MRILAEHHANSENWRLRVEKMRHGNLRVGHIDEDFLHSGDHAQIRSTAEMIAGLVESGAAVRRGEKSRTVGSFAPGLKSMRAEVSWVDRTGAPQSIVLDTVIAAADPALSGRLTMDSSGGGGAALPPAQGADRGRHRRRRDLHHLDGRQRRTAPGLHRSQRHLCPQYRCLITRRPRPPQTCWRKWRT